MREKLTLKLGFSPSREKDLALAPFQLSLKRSYITQTCELFFVWRSWSSCGVFRQLILWHVVWTLVASWTQWRRCNRTEVHWTWDSGPTPVDQVQRGLLLWVAQSRTFAPLDTYLLNSSCLARPNTTCGCATRTAWCAIFLRIHLQCICPPSRKALIKPTWLPPVTWECCV